MTNTYETLVGCFHSFSTINKAITAGRTNIRVATDIEEDETIYVKEPISIFIDSYVRVHFSQKNAFIIDGGSLLLHGSDTGDKDARKHKSTISCCKDCVLISPETQTDPAGYDACACNTILMDLRIESPGSISITGSDMAINNNYFLCQLNMNKICNSSICSNIIEEEEPGKNIKGSAY